MFTAVFKDAFIHKWPVLLAGLIAYGAMMCLAIIRRQRLRARSISNIPLVGQEFGNASERRKAFMSNAASLYREGYQKFKGQMFRLTTYRNEDVIVLPPKYLAEVRNLPEDWLSAVEPRVESLKSDYTRVRPFNPMLEHAIRGTLTPSLVRVTPFIVDQVQASLKSEIPPCDDWTPIQVNAVVLRILAMVTGRIFVGPELCQSDAYVNNAINFTEDHIHAIRQLTAIPSFLRPVMRFSLSYVKRLDQHQRDGVALLQPVIESRLAMAPKDRPDDILQWMIDSRPLAGHFTSKQIAAAKLRASSTAIHSASVILTNCFFNLAAFPEVALELRQEVLDVLAENDNQFTSTTLHSLRKVDSFLRETTRWHPISLALFSRKVLRPITLSNGQIIPAGSVIEAPVDAVNYDESLYPEPDKFDPMRFYRLRSELKENDETVRYAQFMSVTPQNLTFGYGRNACPGRFFATAMMKSIIANALLNFEIKVAEGEGRSLNTGYGGESIPDSKKTVLFKKIAPH